MPAATFFNKLSFRLRPALRRYYGSAWFINSIAFYFRNIIPLLRRFSPLYGATAVLSLTYRCQCSCPHCGVGLYRRKEEEELSPAEIAGLIDELARLGGACVHFFGGEPLIVSALPDYVAHAKSRGLLATVDTNGLLLNEAMVLKLKTSGIDLIRVSLDSPREEEHDRLRGVKGTWRAALDGVRLCVKHGIPCFLSIYATGENLASGDFERMIAMAREAGAGVRFLAAKKTGRWGDHEEVKLSAAEIDRLRSLLADDVAWETDFLRNKNTPFWCNFMLGNKFEVSAYGDIMPCSYLPAVFGNLRTEPLEAIVRRLWSSEMFRGGSKHFDCPMNDPEFTARYAASLNARLEKRP